MGECLTQLVKEGIQENRWDDLKTKQKLISHNKKKLAVSAFYNNMMRST